MLSREDKKLIKFLRDIQGSSKYKGNDKLSIQRRQQKQAIYKELKFKRA